MKDIHDMTTLLEWKEIYTAYGQAFFGYCKLSFHDQASRCMFIYFFVNYKFYFFKLVKDFYIFFVYFKLFFCLQTCL